MHIDEARIPRYILKGIVVSIWLSLQNLQDGFLKSVSSIEKINGPLDIELFKDQLVHLKLLVYLVLIDLRPLTEKHLYDFLPILQQALSTDLVGVDVIRAKPLHAKVVDEPVSLQVLHALVDHTVFDLFGNEAEGYRESITIQ